MRRRSPRTAAPVLRALDRIARAARTTADLGGINAIRAEHVAEAIQYRGLERLGTAA